jgi:bifunctional non-homologous end joining protein LigD
MLGNRERFGGLLMSAFDFNQCKTPNERDLDKVLSDKAWIMEPKIDGWRIQMDIIPGSRVQACTRTHHDAAGKLIRPEMELQAAFAVLRLGRTVFDGEAVYVSPEGLPDFSWTSSVMGSGLDVCIDKQFGSDMCLSYKVFDLFMFDGHDMRDQAYYVRRAALETIFTAGRDLLNYVSLVETEEPSVETHLRNIEIWGEGSILKNINATYAGKRTKDWFKWKAQPDEDVVIMGFKEGQGKYEGQIGAIMFGQYKDGELIERGYCSGMTDDVRRYISRNREDFIRRVLTIKTFGILANEGFRHPQWSHIRQDKEPSDCLWT